MFNRKLDLSGMVLMFVVLVVGLFGDGVDGGEYTFTEIAHSSDEAYTWISRDHRAAINSRGMVTFLAEINLGHTGIFRGDGQTTTTITDTIRHPQFGGYEDFNSINDDGAVVFRTLDQSLDRDDTYIGDGSFVTRVARDDSIKVGYGINNSGHVVYSNWDGVTRGVPGNMEVVADFSDRLQQIEFPDINDSDEVVFFAKRSASNISSIVFGDASGLKVLFDSNGNDVFKSFGWHVGPSLNDRSQVAIQAQVGSPSRWSIGVIDGDEFHDYLDGARDFDRMYEYSINDDGVVAFKARLLDNREGIFVGPDIVNDKVIATGDMLMGRPVHSVWFWRDGFNDEGQVAFTVLFNGGSVGVYRADPVAVPEPGVVGLLLVGVGVVGSRRESRG